MSNTWQGADLTYDWEAQREGWFASELQERSLLGDCQGIEADGSGLSAGPRSAGKLSPPSPAS